MKKNKSVEWTDIFHGIWKIFLVAVILFVLGILGASTLIYQEIVPLSYTSFLVYAVVAWTAFGTSICAILMVSHHALPKTLITEMMILALLLLSGMLSEETATDWIALAISLVVAVLTSVVTVLSFGGIKKKKFKKNASIRLKKR